MLLQTWQPTQMLCLLLELKLRGKSSRFPFFPLKADQICCCSVLDVKWAWKQWRPGSLTHQLDPQITHTSRLPFKRTHRVCKPTNQALFKEPHPLHLLQKIAFLCVFSSKYCESRNHCSMCDPPAHPGSRWGLAQVWINWRGHNDVPAWEVFLNPHLWFSGVTLRSHHSSY